MQTSTRPPAFPSPPPPPATLAANEKLASGPQSSLTEPNVWQTQTFTPQMQWGNDYMHARYYSSNLGRFLSVDPVGGTVGSSQSWNRYAYVENNPIASIDPTGREKYGISGQDIDDQAAQNSFEARAAQLGDDGAASFGTGDEFISKMEGLDNIEEAHVFSHGWDAGLIGADGAANEGLYYLTSAEDSPAAADVADFAVSVATGRIDLAENATITLYACRSDFLAQSMSIAFGEIGRADVSVTGAEGAVAPIVENGREVGATNGLPGERFNTYRNGTVVESRRSIRW